MPKIDLTTWRLQVIGLVNTPLTLTLDELRAMETASVTCVLECAGNGRGLMKLPNTSGTQWEHGAVGNAAWTGVKLATLLARAGVKDEAKHVWLEAADFAPMPATPPFVRSIPLAKATEDVLLAHQMNGAPLTTRHGAPLRAVVPGWYGMASTKWVTKVRLEAEPSNNHFMVKGYRYVVSGCGSRGSAAGRGSGNQVADHAPARGCARRAGQGESAGLRVGGARGCEAVEVSIDGGKTWLPAAFTGESAAPAWRQWTADVDVKAPKKVAVMACATDGNGVAQPIEPKLNNAGYANNMIHKVAFDVRA